VRARYDNGTDDELFALIECANVSHQVTYLILLQVALKGWHSIFALTDDTAQLIVRLALNFFRSEISNLQSLSHLRVTGPVGTMALGAFGSEEIFR
jgi:hypothetical protein